MPLPLRLILHIIPVLIIGLEYISITTSLKIAQTMGDYANVEIIGGLIRIGGNISYHSVTIVLTVVHIFCLIFALFYFYMVALYGLGRDTFGPGPGRVTSWQWSDE